MSLFGYFVVARSERPLVGALSVQRLLTEDSDGIGPGEFVGRWVDGDWQFLQVLGGYGLEASELAADICGPALVIYVIEGAIGNVMGALPDGTGWSGVLNPTDAIQAFEMPEDVVDTVEETTERSVAWARAVGRAPDEMAVAAAVDRFVGPFGESVEEFIRALGFRFGDRQATKLPG